MLNVYTNQLNNLQLCRPEDRFLTFNYTEDLLLFRKQKHFSLFSNFCQKFHFIIYLEIHYDFNTCNKCVIPALY